MALQGANFTPLAITPATSSSYTAGPAASNYFVAYGPEATPLDYSTVASSLNHSFTHLLAEFSATKLGKLVYGVFGWQPAPVAKAATQRQNKQIMAEIASLVHAANAARQPAPALRAQQVQKQVHGNPDAFGAGEQNTQLLPAPTTKYHYGQTTCATGAYSIHYADEDCANSNSTVLWNLTLPIDESTLQFPFARGFKKNYCQCAVHEVMLYFQKLENEASICTVLYPDLQQLKYELDNNGEFVIFSSQGILQSELNADFSKEAIQGCFNEHFKAYTEKEATYQGTMKCVTLLCLASILTYAIVTTRGMHHRRIIHEDSEA